MFYLGAKLTNLATQKLDLGVTFTASKWGLVPAKNKCRAISLFSLEPFLYKEYLNNIYKKHSHNLPNSYHPTPYVQVLSMSRFAPGKKTCWFWGGGGRIWDIP